MKAKQHLKKHQDRYHPGEAWQEWDGKARIPNPFCSNVEAVLRQGATPLDSLRRNGHFRKGHQVGLQTRFRLGVKRPRQHPYPSTVESSSYGQYEIDRVSPSYDQAWSESAPREDHQHSERKWKERKWKNKKPIEREPD
jgi:hypothetical protein